MGEGVDGSGGLLEPVFGICIAQSHKVGVHHQHLFNRPRPDDAVYQYCQQVYPPHAEYVVREDEILLG